MAKKWWEAVRDGEVDLSIDLLLDTDSKIEGAKPVIQTLAGHVKKHAADLTPQGGYTAPIQPITFIIESTTAPPENYIKDWMDVFGGSGGLRMSVVKFFERFSYSESSSLHGAMLQKVQYQRNQAKDLLATIQNIKSAIINIESDLEKLREQIDAFKSGNWGQIKGLFIDNYGGPDRSWTAAARHVPIVRLALTWFLRLQPKEEVPLSEFFSVKVKGSSDREKIEALKKEIKEACEKNKKAMLEEVDKLVKEEKMNPALGNYLKRKIEEFWNWVANYADWLKTTYERIQENLIQQKANLKMYMKWAADAIKNAELMNTSPEEFQKDILPEYFMKFTPSEAVYAEYLFAADGNKRPDIWDITKPYVPVITTKIIVFTRVEVQNRISDVIFIVNHGYMHVNDYEMVKQIATEGWGSSLLNVMIKAGALTKEEAMKIFTEEEMKEIFPQPEKKKLSAQEKFVEKVEVVVDNIVKFLELFGFELPKEGIPWIRSVRAASYAFTLAVEGINRYKASYGMLQLPL